MLLKFTLRREMLIISGRYQSFTGGKREPTGAVRAAQLLKLRSVVTSLTSAAPRLTRDETWEVKEKA